ILSAFFSFGMIVYGFGFYLDNVQMTWVYRCYDLLILSFIVNYLLGFLYSFKRISFLKRTWFEILLLSIVVANYFLEDIYNLESQRVFYKIHIVLYLILLSGYEFVNFSTRINLIKFRPTTMFLVSFLLLIGV